MSDISVTLTSGPTINVEIIGTGPTSTLPTASAETLGAIKVGENLKIDANGALSVDTAAVVEQGNNKPVSSGAVKDAYVALSNMEIEALIDSVV